MIQIQESINPYVSGTVKRRTRMINLKKQDNVADAVNEILQQEALKGNQHLIDKNKNNKVDPEDFKILRGEKKVKEEIDMDDRTKDTLVGREKTKQKDDVGPNSNAKVSKFKLKSEESEQIDELSKSTLSSYLDKKKSEYMKGKTQSGSKENAKDIQNMGKAHDKMKKEETQFNDHEKGAAQRLRDRRKNEKEAEKMDKQYQAMRNKKTLKQMKERLEEPILDELIYEVMSQDASAGDYIHDFIHSDNPKFAGKSDAKRKEMALGAYYSKKNEEVESIDEGWDDMVKDAKEKVKSGPKPSGGSGVKQGTRYGGSKQKEKPEQDVKEATDTVEKDPKTGKVKSWMHTGDWKKDNRKAGRGKVTNMSDKARRRTEKMSEGKDPNMDAGVGSQPNFATDMTKPMKVAQTLAKKSLGRMRNEMMGKKNV